MPFEPSVYEFLPARHTDPVIFFLESLLSPFRFRRALLATTTLHAHLFHVP